MTINDYRWDSLLTLRLPKITDHTEARKIIQRELIRPLSSLLKDEHGTCKLAGIGVYATEPARHAHILLTSNVPLPVIDGRVEANRSEYDRWRRRLRFRAFKAKSGKRITQPAMIDGGRKTVLLEPVRDQADALHYVFAHLNDPGSQELTFGLRILAKLLQQQEAA